MVDAPPQSNATRIALYCSLLAGAVGGAIAGFGNGIAAGAGGIGFGSAIGWVSWFLSGIIAIGLLLIATLLDRRDRTGRSRSVLANAVWYLGVAVLAVAPVIGFVASRHSTRALLAFAAGS